MRLEKEKASAGVAARLFLATCPIEGMPNPTIILDPLYLTFLLHYVTCNLISARHMPQLNLFGSLGSYSLRLTSMHNNYYYCLCHFLV